VVCTAPRAVGGRRARLHRRPDRAAAGGHRHEDQPAQAMGGPARHRLRHRAHAGRPLAGDRDPRRQQGGAARPEDDAARAHARRAQGAPGSGGASRRPRRVRVVRRQPEGRRHRPEGAEGRAADRRGPRRGRARLGRRALMLVATAILAAAPAWASLFNGHDLAGWETWLGIPDQSEVGLDLPRDQDGRYTAALGLNVDPKHVFTVVEMDGKPAIRISGQGFGALTGKQEYDDFHLRMEFKWGEKKWPPRENVVRDSGILYYAVGEHGA